MSTIHRLHPKLLIIGGIALDMTGHVGKNVRASVLQTSSPGKVRQTLGGVGRNVCEASWRDHAPAALLSVIGDDLAGICIKQGMAKMDMDTRWIKTLPNQATAVYSAIHDQKGQLVAAVADMNIFDSIDARHVNQTLIELDPQLVCFDGNIPAKVMTGIATTCQSLNIPVLFEPTSVFKATLLFQNWESIQNTRSIHYTTPNQFELEAMCDAVSKSGVEPIWPRKESAIVAEKPLADNGKTGAMPGEVRRLFPLALHLSRHIPHVITKLGELGCLHVGQTPQGLVIDYLGPEPIDAQKIRNVTGAGDTFVGVLLASLWRALQSGPNELCTSWRTILSRAQKAAVLTLQSDTAVNPDISQLAMPESS